MEGLERYSNKVDILYGMSHGTNVSVGHIVAY